MCRNENKSLSTGLIHQSVKTAGLRQHKGHCQCANHFPDTSASLQAGHQHNLVQGHCLNLRCVKKTNWWRGKSSCATSWEMRGNQWILNGPFIRVVAVLCGNGGQKESKHHHIWKNVFIQNCKLGKIKNAQVFETLCRHRPQTSPNNWKHHREKDMEIQGPCTSRDRLVTIPNLPMVAPVIDLSQFSMTWSTNFQFVDSSGQKGNLIRLHLQFLVEKCNTQIFKNVWIDGSASGDWRPCDAGLRSLALVAWRGLRIAHSHREASEAADTLQDWKTSCGTTSNCTYGPWSQALMFRLS